MAAKYAQGIDNLIKKVENTTLNNVGNTITQSESLGRLTQISLEGVTKVEQTIEDYEQVMSDLDFYVRQEYNIARYKLDTSVSAQHWDYYGRASYVWAG